MMNTSKKRGNSRYYLYLFLFALAILLSRLFLWEHFRVPSGSMIPTIVPGDFILVNKQVGGPRILNLSILFKEKKVEYLRLKGWGNLKRGDVVVFQQPRWSTDSLINSYGDFFVKRCMGIPGDTLHIDTSDIRFCEEEPCISMLRAYSIIQDRQDMNNLHRVYPHHKRFNNWNIMDYGPLWIPRAGKTIVLDSMTSILYADIIRMECKEFVPDSTGGAWINGKAVPNYTFKQNYYFMMGDNFFGSSDSREWGFVPESHIVGRVFLVAFSANPYRRWYKSIQWKRFFGKISKL